MLNLNNRIKNARWILAFIVLSLAPMIACDIDDDSINDYTTSEVQKFENRIDDTAYQGCMAINDAVNSYDNNQQSCANMHK